MSQNVTDKLANFIECADYSDFTAEVIAAAKTSLLDFIGVAIAGFRETQLNVTANYIRLVDIRMPPLMQHCLFEIQTRLP